MLDWLRRADPAFYHKEPRLLQMQAQVGRYTDEAQAQIRLNVLSSDRILHVATAVFALAAFAVATAAGALDERHDWAVLWAFAVLAVAAPCALAWGPPSERTATWRQPLAGSALIVLSGAGARIDLARLLVALAVGATLYLARGRARVALPAVAVGVLFAVPLLGHPPAVVALLAGVFAAGAGVLLLRAVARVWLQRPQVVTWSALAILLAACAYAFACDAPAVALRVPGELGAIVAAYICVCIMAGRIRRAELVARPDGALSIPQSIVPLLDRSHHHAIICWLE